MAEILKGAPVSEKMIAKMKEDISLLKKRNISPVLGILRVGEREDDVAYEKGILKRCEQTGVDVRHVILPKDISQKEFDIELEKLNTDMDVHGILMFRPLPGQLDDEAARNAIIAKKDVDGCTDMSLSGVFTGSKTGFPPCTAEAVIKILEYYDIAIEGKKAVIIGRSLVIGRPVAMMLMEKGATPVICHSKTNDVASFAKDADIIIAASGRPESVGEKYLREGQTVIDVGISWSEEKQKLVGDVLFEDAEQIVEAVTPVPGGVGAVTTSVLLSHVIKAAKLS